MTSEAQSGKQPQPDVKGGLRMLVTGTSPYWNEVTADLLRIAGFSCGILHGRPHRTVLSWLLGMNWRNMDAFYMVSPTGHWIITLLMIRTRKPCILHWIGTDVLSFRQGKVSRGWRNRLLRRLFRKKGPLIHLADSEDLQKELRQEGIEAPVVHLVPQRVRAEIMDLPNTFRVLSYWHDHTMDFFNGPLVLRLAEEFPEIEFRIVGAGGKGISAPPNVLFLGHRRDIENIYRDTSVLIRMPKHDSLGMMVLEMLARGRYVMYNKAIPHCHLVHSFEQARQALQEIRQKKEPNQEGARYVQEHFSPDREAEKLAGLIGKLLQDRAGKDR